MWFRKNAGGTHYGSFNATAERLARSCLRRDTHLQGKRVPEALLRCRDVDRQLLGECEQAYPAIYQVVHGKMAAAEAAAAVLMRTEGEA